jgi:hypothetical protein
MSLHCRLLIYFLFTWLTILLSPTLQEEEEEVVNETPKKKNWSRDGENPIPWKVASLSVTRKEDDVNFEDKRRKAKESGEHAVASWEEVRTCRGLELTLRRG